MARPRIAVLLSKDPTTTRSGDMEMNELLIDLAREVAEVTVICLSDQPHLPPEPGLVRVPKPPVRPIRLVAQSLRSRRSLVFSRFDTSEMVRAIDAVDADLHLAVHLYMAESYFRTAPARRGSPLLATAVVSEAMVWAQTRGLVGRLQAPLIRRDERRVARAATTVAAYDAGEADQALLDGAAAAAWLPLTSSPMTPISVADSPPTLVLLGDRTWAPNEEASQLAIHWWPAISAGIPGAELLLVGKPAPDARARGALPPGVHDLGFVDDLEETLSRCRGMLAPVLTGGGVRVKILAAAARGLPVVATSTAIGSLDRILPLVGHDTEVDFVRAARLLLHDAAGAAASGSDLHEANEQHHRAGGARQAFRAWIDPWVNR